MPVRKTRPSNLPSERPVLRLRLRYAKSTFPKSNKDQRLGLPDLRHLVGIQRPDEDFVISLGARCSLWSSKYPSILTAPELTGKQEQTLRGRMTMRRTLILLLSLLLLTTTITWAAETTTKQRTPQQFKANPALNAPAPTGGTQQPSTEQLAAQAWLKSIVYP